MNVYRRYFRVTAGPMIDSIKKCEQINKEANKEFAKILKELGANDTYYHRDGRLIAMQFDGDVDRDKYKRMNCGGWYPKRNNKEGRALHKRIESITTRNENDSLKEIGLTSNPTIFGAGRCYFPSMTKIPSDPPVVFISVPWYDENPEDISAYKKDRDAGKRGDGNIDAVLWEPSEDMEEIKEWQVSKEIDEWNSREK